MRWHVTPVTVSPSKIAQKPDQQPRCLGRSEGWKFMQSAQSSRMALGNLRRYDAETTRSGANLLATASTSSSLSVSSQGHPSLQHTSVRLQSAACVECEMQHATAAPRLR
eukprot:CAMPEP_0170572026 /NCGR_PEP_ID=MMETSP0224-20130122/1992_1 /TAXON_ID=285029 /ORGANISM="Togula jolla, Strain CCCM 725" /LENGTH=109 /DNA_ID=CAMNT_0010894479 /DNA_START=383 /DNA_END=712 /DNA_ORIENTATION=+